MKYKLLLVTVTYKPKVPELYEFIDSFEKYNDLGEAAKLVVVDNSPASFWNVSVARRKYPFVDFYENPSNPGFGAANNIGFGLFESEYVLFMNNDAEFTEPVFNKCIALFEENQQLGCLGIGQVGSLSFFYRSESPLKKKELKRRLKAGLFDPCNFFLSGAFLMLRSFSSSVSGKRAKRSHSLINSKRMRASTSEFDDGDLSHDLNSGFSNP